MVLRKPTPTPNLVPAPLSHAVNDPPYPVTPSSERPPSLPTTYHSPGRNTPVASGALPPGQAANKLDDDDLSDYNSDSDGWDRSDDDDVAEAANKELPGTLKIGGGRPIPSPGHKNADSLPDVLKTGNGQNARVSAQPSWEKMTPQPTGATAASWGAVSNSSGGSLPLKTNNPYLRMQTTGQSNIDAESSQQAWGRVSASAQPYGEIAELPSDQPPVTMSHQFANTNFDSGPPLELPPFRDQLPLIAVEEPTPLQSPDYVDGPHHPGMDISSIDAWSRTVGLPADNNVDQVPPRTWQEQQDWDKSERERKQEEFAAAHEIAVMAEQAAKSPPITEEQHAPELPPRRSQEQEQAPPMPPRPMETGASTPHHDLESPNTVMNRQRKEHYPIKHIRWLDATSQKIRIAPILTQNINGPCPLLALVNALVLSTPAELRTEFVETLRTREQVSLGLLVDAVIEELLSGRRGNEVGDVNDLYKFLIGLQTGLNVNPMFVHDPDAIDSPSGLDLLESPQPGGFENTREMRLYKIFNVQLFHGWLPEPGSNAYMAFERVAKTYESSQYVQFQEEELEAKLQAEGLNTDEQRLFTDIHAIKEFLSRWPTQLTDYGLRSMQKAIKPGQVGILFRNDHFSTLYKNPHTNELMTLVTDQGYATHDEIVWESLVDVSGRGSELYSGDFRPIGGNSSTPPRPQQQQYQPPVQSLLDIGESSVWTPVSSHTRRPAATSSPPHQAPTSSPSAAATGLSKTEQEDHDLALALQLQEEEEDRHRRTVEDRQRREIQLSEDALATEAASAASRSGNRRTSQRLQGENLNNNNQNNQSPPVIPPRRNNLPVQRPAQTGGASTSNGEPAPPPTYEEAATTPKYYPPLGHPANPNTPLQNSGGVPGAAFQQQDAASSAGGGRRVSRPNPVGQLQGLQPQGLAPQGSGPMRNGRRTSGAVGPGPAGAEQREKCVVM